MQKTLHFFKIFFYFLAFAIFAIGCGSGDGGIDDWTTPAPVTVVSNIQGKVALPVSGSVRDNLQLMNSVQGTKVFLEEKPEFYATADSSGNFIINKVPVGKYHLIADIVVGPTTYRQRTDQVNLTGEFETQTIGTPMQLVSAPYKVKLYVKNNANGNPIPGASLKVWGHKYFTRADGAVEIGPMPDGVWPVKLEAIGYISSSLLIGFKELRKSELEIKVTPLGSADRNQAPTIEIEQGFKTIKANEQGSLSAFGFDPDGDLITYTWSATAGTFQQNSGASNVYQAPNASGSVKITLKGSDGKGGEGVSILTLDVIDGGLLPPNPNNKPPLAPSNPFPANSVASMGTDITLRWTCSDPDGDNLTYDVFLAARGQEMQLVASNISNNYYRVPQLTVNTTYFWKIIARDTYGAISNAAQTWQFETGDQDNFSPYAPANPVPPDLSVDQLPTLVFAWTGGDPDSQDIVNYTVYLGSDSNVLNIATNTRKTTYAAEGLTLGRTYYWKIVASDDRGKETSSPLWRFSTYSPPNSPPDNPSALYPASGATDVSIDVQVRWTSSDPDGDSITYDLFLGKTFPLAKVGTGLNAPTYNPSPYFENSTRYFWQVIARDSSGRTNQDSVVWSFITSDKVNLAPNVPSAINPPDNSANINLQTVFQWEGSDPDGDQVLFDIYLDTVSPPTTLKASNLSEKRWANPVNLTEGARYFWKVVAKDSAGHETSSPVFSFYALASSDLLPPKVLSIFPENNAMELPTNTEVKVTFNEAVDQNTASAALSFIPSESGTWTWENSTTVKFWPTTTWIPGSYHRLIIASNTVRDLSNNVMTNGMDYSFTIKPELPLPNGYRSAGFPYAFTSGQSPSVSIPGIPLGQELTAVAVATENSLNLTIKANSLLDIKKLDPASAFREFEKNLNSKKLPDIMKNSALRAQILPNFSKQLGDEREFYIPAYGGVATSTAYPKNKITAVCLGLTDNVYIFVDKAITNPDYTFLSEVRKRFEEGIQPKVRDVFGNEPSVGPDGDGRLSILITDAMASGIAGIFYGVDLFANDPTDFQLRESNETKVFYLTYTLPSDITRYGTMAHEFQHMVNFWQKRTNAGSGVSEETWLNEGLSKFSEEVCGYGILNGDQNTSLLIKLSQENFSNMSLTEWTGLNSYGLSYLFVKFLSQENRYGTSYREVTRSLVRSGLTGVANVESVTGEAFGNTLSRWAISLYLNNYQGTSPDDFGFSGLDMKGTYNSVTLPGFPSQVISSGGTLTLSPPLKKHGVAIIRSASDGSNPVKMNFSGLTGNGKIWFLDKRP